MFLSCTRYGHWLAYGSWMVRNLSFGLWPLFQLWKLDLRRRWLNFLNFSFLKPYSKEQILIAEILLLCNWIESKWGNKLLILFCFEGVGNDPREDRYFSIPKQVSSLNYHSKSENLWFIYFMVHLLYGLEYVEIWRFVYFMSYNCLNIFIIGLVTSFPFKVFKFCITYLECVWDWNWTVVS